MRFPRAAAIGLLVLVTAAWAAPKTITLSVPGMTCATCPITIRAALKKVPGVTDVTVSYERLEAVVTFDDTKTNTAALIKATTDAGYPSTVKPAAPTVKGPR
jgi:mercuric ion binding protein